MADSTIGTAAPLAPLSPNPLSTSAPAPATAPPEAVPEDRVELSGEPPVEQAPPRRSEVARVVAGDTPVLDTLKAAGKALTSEHKAFALKGDVGGYDGRLDIGRAQLSPRHGVSPDLAGGTLEVNPSVRLEASVVSGALENSQPAGGEWTQAQGVRAGVHGRYDLDLKKVVSGTYAADDARNAVGLEARGEGYRNYSRPVGEHGTLTLGAQAGVAQNLLGEGTAAHAQVVQEYKHDISPLKNLLGGDSSLTLRAREGLHATPDGILPRYEAFAGMSQQIPLRLAEGDRKVTLGVGAQVSGDASSAPTVRPDLAVALDW